MRKLIRDKSREGKNFNNHREDSRLKRIFMEFLVSQSKIHFVL